ncbi:DUF3750 domain-containing protein [Thalassomonas haliotis]|uniref:DUF3750 domain-containing protein n=1 Tax=Thalassomonas haliotis TaxID=485448 RepID=A0ABY7V9D3_9GAMM|nr:DUF3750 domain-containing protein [Thalassomonas haliotis]WDE10202.1 DUF3750 domain-containing protein [Thalassomonas haliotis]
MKKLFRIILAAIAVILFTGFLSSCSSNKAQTRGKFAPKAAEFPGAVIQVYSARTWGAKQAVSVHTWISTKRSGEQHYTSYEIIGWRLRRHHSALVVRDSLPDRDWWGHQPQLLLDYRGADTDQLIDKIAAAVAQYPYKNEYQAYPGPNSNTFTASIARAVPELGLDLPSTAIGKDYSPITKLVGPSPSGSGYQFSLLGMLGVTVGVEEGLELNLLGLNFEFDIFDLAIELPGIGRIGADQVSSETFAQESQTLVAGKAKTSARTVGE